MKNYSWHFLTKTNIKPRPTSLPETIPKNISKELTVILHLTTSKQIHQRGAKFPQRRQDVCQETLFSTKRAVRRAKSMGITRERCLKAVISGKRLGPSQEIRRKTILASAARFPIQGNFSQALAKDLTIHTGCLAQIIASNIQTSRKPQN
jgi:hypothetical protein